MKLPWRRAAPGSERFLAPFDGVATADDVFHCFRLLLGRHPGREELPGHMSHVGQRLERVVPIYLDSREFAERRLGRGQAGENGHRMVTTAEGFLLLVAPDDAAVGGPVASLGLYEPNVTRVIGERLAPGMRVVDIGANIGWFTMLAASRVGPSGHVTAVEPNGGNVRALESSRRANGFSNVLVLQAAAARTTGLLALYRAHSNGSTAALGADADVLGAETVAALRLDDVLDRTAGPVDLVKIDVEGAEASALEGFERTLRADRPVIVSEFSPSMMPGVSGVTGAAYADWLIGLGYRLAAINPDGSVTPCAVAADAIEAHRRSGIDHIDLLCEPDPPRAS